MRVPYFASWRDSQSTGQSLSLIVFIKIKNPQLRVILIGELFVQIFEIVFAHFFNLPNFPVFFYKYWNVNKLDIFGSGEIHD